MKHLTTIIITFIGAIALITLGITANGSKETESFTGVSMDKQTSSTSMVNKPTIKLAKEITKSECSPRMWKKWKKLDQPVENNVIGVAPLLLEKNGNNNIINVKLYIDDSLKEYSLIEHTAWHECAHAKTYNIETDKLVELHDKVVKAFPDCNYGVMECLADAMAIVKAPGFTNSYYQNSFTEEQLSVAKEVWNASGKVKERTKTTGITWTDLD